MKATLFAISVVGLLGFTSYRAMTIEPDPPVAPNYTNYGGYPTRTPAALHSGEIS